MSETRAEAIARWEAEGYLSPDCPGCKEVYDSPLMPYDVHVPCHKASDKCNSGKRPHCTCDEACW